MPSLPIVRYNITGIEDFAKEMDEKKLGKPKVSLQFQLSESGLTNLIKAEAAVEETYTVEEEVEVDDDDDDDDSDEVGNQTDPGAEENDNKTAERELEEEEKEDGNATVPNATEAKNATTDKQVNEKPKKKKTILQEKVSQLYCEF